MKNEYPGYEESLKELELILKSLESGEISMDKISDLVKRASFLLENCQKNLRNIEKELGKTFEDQ